VEPLLGIDGKKLCDHAENKEQGETTGLLKYCGAQNKGPFKRSERTLLITHRSRMMVGTAIQKWLQTGQGRIRTKY